MAILNIFSAAVPPTDFWCLIILNVFSFVANYGWRIVLFTLCLKLILSPIDIFQRYKARKNQLITIKLKPQMEKLQKIYAGDQQVLARKQMELNKKAGLSYFSSCLPAILTLVIFITLFMFGLQPVSQYQNFSEYEQLNAKYHEFYNDEALQSEYDIVSAEKWDELHAETVAKTDDIRNEQTGLMKESFGKAAYDAVVSVAGEDKKDDPAVKAQAEKAKNDALEAFDAAEHAEEIEAAVADQIERRTKFAVEEIAKNNVKNIARQEVFSYYESDVRTGFLWIKNIWNADVLWTAPINDAATFRKNIGDYGNFSKGKSGFETAEQLAAMLNEYDDVMGALLENSEYNRNNGYCILPIVTILLSVAMQVLSFRQQKESGQMNAQTESQSKMMMFVMPVMMAWFAFSYTAAFAVYLVMNYIVSMVITLIGNFVVKMADKRINFSLENEVQTYGRPDFSDRKNDKK